MSMQPEAPEADACWDRPPDWPAMTLLWWVDGSEDLGRISVWHALTGKLAETGRIGYATGPSYAAEHTRLRCSPPACP
jgi:hypothetical protein